MANLKKVSILQRQSFVSELGYFGLISKNEKWKDWLSKKLIWTKVSIIYLSFFQLC